MLSSSSIWSQPRNFHDSIEPQLTHHLETVGIWSLGRWNIQHIIVCVRCEEDHYLKMTIWMEGLIYVTQDHKREREREREEKDRHTNVTIYYSECELRKNGNIHVQWGHKVGYVLTKLGEQPFMLFTRIA